MKVRGRGKVIAIIIILLLFLTAAAMLLYALRIIPHKQYTNGDFDIEAYVSKVDRDSDGTDDQTDILQSVRQYLETKPKYKSKYYGTGYPDDGYGVCTDVVAQGLKGAGYDLMELVNTDILNNRDKYDIEVVDRNIDFRRVRNLLVFFRNNSISLTTDLYRIEEWQGGDIIVFTNHIGIISDKRNRNGVPFLLHHASPLQIRYEEDVLESYGQDYIVGHFRIS